MPPAVRMSLVGLSVALSGANACAQTYATPLPPGLGSVTMPLPGGPMVAPVLLPVGLPAVAPVAVYHYPGGVPATDCPTYTTPAAGTGCGPRWTVGGEFLFWFTQASTLPPLVTAAAPGTPVPPGGSLGSGATNVLFGGTRADTAGRAGGRFTLGYGSPDAGRVEAAFLFLDDRTDRFAGRSVPGGVTLARPVVFAPTGEPTAVPVATVAAEATTRLLGGEANYRRRLAGDAGSRLDLLTGFRYLHLGDRVELIHTTLFDVIGVGSTGVGLVSDSVRTRNSFYGPQVGLDWRCPLAGRWSLDALAKVGLGVTVARADLDGSTTVGPAGLPVGLLVGPGNTVKDRDTYFGVVPEAGLGVGYQPLECMRLSVGYTFLYWSRVRRAADQLDLSAGTADRPGFRDHTTDYWAQGVRLGLELRF